MKTTHLQHHPKLGYPLAGQLRPLPAELALLHECTSLISFRKPPDRAADAVVKKLHAAQRPLAMYDEGSYCLYAVQNDSPLAPLLLWDAAHFLKVGEKITVIEDTPTDCYLDREYFAGSLKVMARSADSICYEKISKLPAETDDECDGWTFGIPVGPEDATVLNAVVKRILEIDIPNKEILLCGSPGLNFAYLDQVRIVGEDITAPPVQICKKKNRLAHEARYGNLVILHDRVFLPKHFGEMVRRFGSNYPLMTLQSLFFDNHASMHPRRYSDHGTPMGELAQGVQALHRNSGHSVSIAPGIFPAIERTGFVFANCMRYNKDAGYPTGSLYICRTAVWKACPLDESLNWVEFEDIEHGLRASKAGIPYRINPHGITQSITSRPQLGQQALVEGVDGSFQPFGPNNMSMLRKKPLIRMSAQAALKRLHHFERKYVVNPAITTTPVGMLDMGAGAWVRLINNVIQRAAFRNDIDSVREFIADFQKYVLLDELSTITQQHLINSFLIDPVSAKRGLITRSAEIRNMLRQRIAQTWFASSPDEFFHHKVLSLPGIMISAICAHRNRNRIFYFDSVGAAVKAIYNSTPFTSYTKVSK
jgi:hypothetical protein